MSTSKVQFTVQYVVDGECFCDTLTAMSWGGIRAAKGAAVRLARKVAEAHDVNVQCYRRENPYADGVPVPFAVAA